jgi:UDP-N-acetylmuramoyl-tripeptide--D-alanyl-D-alanine ligase
MPISELYKIFLKHPIVCTDSRKITPDCLFFALKGANFNGNRFAVKALEQGAAFAIIDEKKYAVDDRCVLVEDVLTTLQQLANHHRNQFEIPVIAITGSNGKTTTKELINTILSLHYPCHSTQGNFNNHIGVPLTLLAMPLKTEVAIIEMGANHIGEIDFLCQIAEPTHGVITNVGAAHLEGFGSLEGVKKAKGELYRYLERTNGLAFINLDEDFLMEMAGDKLYKVAYRKNDNPDLKVPEFETKLVAANPFIEVAFLSKKGNLQNISSQLIGLYNFNNIMTATALGRYFKVPFVKIKSAIQNYNPTNNRSQIIEKDGNKYLLDAYNANPTSMTKALQSFATYKGKKKIAILGDMLELGNFSETAHREILDLAENLDIDVITVGKLFLKIKKNRLKHFLNIEALKGWFWEQNYADTFFLLKGSRGIGLERLLK